MKKQCQPSTSETAGSNSRQGDICDLTIATLDEEGYGIGRLAETPVLVSGVLPGETVRAKITFSGRREIFAVVVKVLRHSPTRLQTPPCAHAADCDGTPLISMKYPAQLDWKRGIVENALRGYAALQGVTPLPVLPSPRQLHYRNSATLVIAGKFSAPVIGIHHRNSRDLLDIGDCPLYHPLINRVVQVVKDGIRKGKVPVYSSRSASGLLRYLLVRVSEAENRVMVVFVTAERSFNEIHHLGKYLQEAVPEVETVVQNVNGSPGNAILGEKEYFAGRKQFLTDTIGDIRFVISPRSSFPVNPSGALLVYEKVREWANLSGRETVIDLDWGSGGFPLFLAAGAKKIVAIRTSAAAAAGEKNAQHNSILNCRFETGDAAELLAELNGEGKDADLVILNPPRKGYDGELLRQVALLAAPRIIYVSGTPRDMARDLDIFARLGYRTLELQTVDMFPQTSRMEIVSLLVKG